MSRRRLRTLPLPFGSSPVSKRFTFFGAPDTVGFKLIGLSIADNSQEKT